MPVNRDLWGEQFGPERVPAWHCPSCSGGYVKLKPSSFHFAETAETIQSRDCPAFEWDWITYRFSCLLECNNSSCKEILSVVGIGKVIEFIKENDYSELHYDDAFFPQYIRPSPNLISLPPNCPEEVTKELKRAFVQSWGDFRAAANSIRTAVENLLDFLKVPKQQLNKQKKLVTIKLHDRISTLEKRNPTLATLAAALFALKHIGNAGSHRTKVSKDDIYDMLDILETALEQCFNDKKKIQRKIKKINQRKGPLRKTKVRSRSSI